MRLWMVAVVASFVLGAASTPAFGQKAAKYGADFLAGGVGARALGMGGAYVAHTADVTAGYWNPAGLSRMAFPEFAYMHAERFDGIVAFDYGSAAFPINARSTVGLSFFRSGVDDIPNTLNAWDRERNAPKPNPEDYVTRFSAADYAFFVSYARRLSGRLSAGLTGKVIRRSIGDFADAWGYSFDLGVQYRTERFVFGANLQDLSTMLQSWSINPAAFRTDDVNPATGERFTFEELFSQQLPEGGTYVVLPVARLGSGVVLPLGGDTRMAVGLDVDLAFDGQQANAFNAGDVSFHPRLGTEVSYKDLVALRAGVSRVTRLEGEGLSLTPTVGAGLQFRQLAVDYGFGDFAGLASDLGYSHRLSLQLRLGGERWQRAAP